MKRTVLKHSNQFTQTVMTTKMKLNLLYTILKPNLKPLHLTLDQTVTSATQTKKMTIYSNYLKKNISIRNPNKAETPSQPA